MNLVEQAKKAYLDESRAEIFYKSPARRARGRLAEKLERLARMEHGHAALLGRRGVDPHPSRSWTRGPGSCSPS